MLWPGPEVRAGGAAHDPGQPAPEAEHQRVEQPQEQPQHGVVPAAAEPGRELLPGVRRRWGRGGRRWGRGRTPLLAERHAGRQGQQRQQHRDGDGQQQGGQGPGHRQRPSGAGRRAPPAPCPVVSVPIDHARLARIGASFTP